MVFDWRGVAAQKTQQKVSGKVRAINQLRCTGAYRDGRRQPEIRPNRVTISKTSATICHIPIVVKIDYPVDRYSSWSWKLPRCNKSICNCVLSVVASSLVVGFNVLPSFIFWVRHTSPQCYEPFSFPGRITRLLFIETRVLSGLSFIVSLNMILRLFSWRNRVFFYHLPWLWITYLIESWLRLMIAHVAKPGCLFGLVTLLRMPYPENWLCS